MLVKPITYVDYNGETRTEEFRFNLSRAEVLEMEMSTPGGMTTYLDNLVKAKDVPALVKAWKEIVFKAYGVKSPDGRRFIKSPEISEEFAQTEAYSELFVELTSDSKKAAEFFNAIIPKKQSEA